MKIAGLSLGFSWIFLACALGQVSVEVVLDQEQFLPNESLEAAVRVSNQSGRTLDLGNDDEWLGFSVESRDNFVVQKTGEVPVAGKFFLESSKVATKRVDLAPYFSLTKVGRYKVTATVRINGWDQAFSSKPKFFEVITGTKLWEREFGVPPAPGAVNAAPEVRRYVLQQANYLKQLRLYVRLTDASDSKTFRVVNAGPMVSVSRPEPQLDKSSNLHLLWQTGARVYTYVVVNPDGELLVRRLYDMANNSRPRLQVDADGKFSISGGARRVTRDDIPPEKPASLNESQPPKS